MRHLTCWLTFATLLLVAGCTDQLVTPGAAEFNKGQGKGKPGGGGNEAEPDFVTGSAAVAMNDHGIVIGFVEMSNGDVRAARWVIDMDGNVSGPDELGTLNGETYSMAPGINNAGVIVGYAEHDSWTRHAFIYDGTLRALAVPDSAVSSWALKINDAGVAVGDATFMVDGQRISRTLVWLDPFDLTKQPVQLPPLDGDITSAGRWINNDGVVGGWSQAGTQGVAVRWQLEEGGTFSGPEKVGDITVYAMSDGPTFAGIRQDQATLLRDGSYSALPPLPDHGNGWARGLNNPLAGQPLQVVGESRLCFACDPAVSGSRPVLWTVDVSGAVSSPIDLGLPGSYEHATASSVNAHGWIAGHGFNAWDDRMATVWRPTAGEAGYEIIMLTTTESDETGPTASFTHSCGNTTTCTFTDTSTSGNSPIIGRAWSSGAGETSDEANPSFSYLAAGSYTVTLVVMDGNGVSDRADGTIICTSHSRHGVRCK